MWILTFIGGVVCAFGVLSVLSNERVHRVRRIQDELRARADAAIEVAEEIPIVGSPIPHAAIHVPQDESVLVR